MRLIQLFDGMDARENVPLRDYTTLCIGGPADVLIEVADEEEILRTMKICRENNVPLLVMGNGSNILFRDGGMRGVVLHLGEKFARIDVSGTTMTAQAGALMKDVSHAACDAALSGLAFAEGIPGTVGGGVFMNAGAYNGEIGPLVASVRAITPDGEAVTLSGPEMDFGYRHSLAQDRKLLITSVTFALQRGNREEIAAEMADLHRRREEKQPLDKHSCGSTFKRPEGHFVGALVDDCALRGTSVGGAMVSTKHAGFLINENNATAKDFLALIELVQRRVYEKSGVLLTPEVRIMGEEAE